MYMLRGLRVTSHEIYHFENEKYGGMSQKPIIGPVPLKEFMLFMGGTRLGKCYKHFLFRFYHEYLSQDPRRKQ